MRNLSFRRNGRTRSNEVGQEVMMFWNWYIRMSMVLTILKEVMGRNISLCLLTTIVNLLRYTRLKVKMKYLTVLLNIIIICVPLQENF